MTEKKREDDGGYVIVGLNPTISKVVRSQVRRVVLVGTYIRFL